MFEELAAENGIQFKVSSNDLQSVIEKEKPMKQRKAFSLQQYNKLEDIFAFLDDMQRSHPEKVTLFTAGESYEGREIKILKISSNENNPAVFIEANIHAREWISSATALWIINEILTTTDSEIREIVDSVTWYILPVTNPDGER